MTSVRAAAWGLAVMAGVALLVLLTAPPPAGRPRADGGARELGPPGDGGSALEPLAQLAVRVTDAQGRTRTAALRLAGVALAEPPVRQARSGADGRFLFEALPAGVYALEATAPGVAGFVDGIRVDVAPDAGVPEVVVTLAAEVAVAGRLHDASSRGVAGEVALACGTSDGALLLSRRVQAAADGTFRVAGLAPGRVELWARADGFVPQESGLVPDGRPLEIALERAAQIEGRIVDEHGLPIAGCVVEIAGETADGTPIVVAAPPSGNDWPRPLSPAGRLVPSGELGVLRGPIPYPPPPSRASGVAARFTSDRAGAFQVAGVPAGRVVVTAVHPDFARGASAPLDAVPGQIARTELVLEHGRQVTGRVTDERGFPIAGAEIAVGGQTLTVSDGRGSFTLSHRVGAVSLSVSAPGHRAVTRVVAAGETEADVELARAEGRLAGVIVDDRGYPLAGAKVEVGGRVLVTDKTGAFRAEGLGPGPYRLKVNHAELAPRAFEQPEPSEELRIALEPGGGVSGEVRDARRGGVPAGAAVTLGQSGDARPLTLKEGRFEATGLARGPALLRARAPGYVAWSRVVDVPPGEHPRQVTVRDVEVALELGGSATGALLDDDGHPVAGATIECGGERARTDAHGEFRVSGLAPGRLRVRASAGGRVVEEEIEVRAGDETRVELRLR